MEGTRKDRMVDYPITESLKRNASIHCTTLAITQNLITGPGWPQAAQPDAALRNGTLTFVKSGGRTYGITCQHVVQHYRDVLTHPIQRAEVHSAS